MKNNYSIPGSAYWWQQIAVETGTSKDIFPSHKHTTKRGQNNTTQKTHRAGIFVVVLSMLEFQMQKTEKRNKYCRIILNCSAAVRNLNDTVRFILVK